MEFVMLKISANVIKDGLDYYVIKENVQEIVVTVVFAKMENAYANQDSQGLNVIFYNVRMNVLHMEHVPKENAHVKKVGEENFVKKELLKMVHV
jgi:hypothetical protein